MGMSAIVLGPARLQARPARDRVRLHVLEARVREQHERIAIGNFEEFDTIVNTLELPRYPYDPDTVELICALEEHSDNERFYRLSESLYDTVEKFPNHLLGEKLLEGINNVKEHENGDQPDKMTRIVGVRDHRLMLFGIEGDGDGSDVADIMREKDAAYERGSLIFSQRKPNGRMGITGFSTLRETPLWGYSPRGLIGYLGFPVLPGP